MTSRLAHLLWFVAAASPLCVAGCGESRPEDSLRGVIGEQGRAPGRFTSPRSIAIDAARVQLSVVDRSGRIQRFEAPTAAAAPGEALPDASSGATASAGSATWAFASEWLLPAWEKGQPTGIQYDRDGHLLVADTHYQRIRLYDTRHGELLRSWGEEGAGDGQFTQVRDVVQASSGAVFASDFSGPADRVQKFDADGRFLLTFGHTGDEPGAFRRPQGLAVQRHEGRGPRETLLVVDSCNHRIQRFTLDGELLEVWGRIGDGPGEFKYPYGVAVEPRADGDLFVVEWGNNRVQRLDAHGRSRGVWGGPGRRPGELATPWDIALDAEGRIYVVDYGNHRVQVFTWPEALAARDRRGGSGAIGSLTALRVSARGANGTMLEGTVLR